MNSSSERIDMPMRRCGAWVRINVDHWLYTARPERFANLRDFTYAIEIYPLPDHITH